MSLNMKTLTQALAKTAAVIEKTVQTTVQEVTGPKPLQDYDLLDQIGSGGPALAWKLYSARPRNKTSPAQYPLVCVWLLDKKALAESRSRAGLSKAAEDTFLDLIRADAARLVRLRHPGVVHVVHALDESKTAMAMVTEPLFASVANVLGSVDNIAKVPSELKGMEMGQLEVKHGLLQVAETLDFLHNNARLIHRGISPEAVFITSSGSWKLGGFCFAISADQATGDLATVQPFHYPEYDLEDSVLPLQPSLNYTAPELVRSNANSTGSSSDIFSLGCLAYHLVARKPFLDSKNNLRMYMNRLTYLSSDAFSSIPLELVNDLQRMLSVDQVSRPNALDFTGSSFFRDDTRLRALRFLDHMLERDNMQKSEFLKALSDMWKDFDSRVLRYKVLPPLCAELRNMVMQPMILPMVLTIAESQDKNDFELSTLPALVPVLSSAAGETLLLLVKHAELIINKTDHEHLVTHVLPLFIRACDDTDARMQEEILRRTVHLAKRLDTQVVKQVILPRVHGLALKTTVAAVRVSALVCLAELVHGLDKHAVLDILQTLQRCTAVDRSPPTLMSTLGVANSIYKQFGLEFAAEHVLPLIVPLLIAQQLNVQQFAKYILFVKELLRKIEEKRGVSVTESGAPEVRSTPSAIYGVQSEPFQRTNGTASSLTKSSSSWDDDWGAMKNGPATSHYPPEPNPFSKPSKLTSHPATVATMQSHPPISTLNHQSAPSCPPVEIEWPPPASYISLGPQVGDIVKQQQDSRGAMDATFDNIDPFANWPPRSSNSIGVGSTSNSTVGLPTRSEGNSVLNTGIPSSLAFESNNPVGLPRQYQGGPVLNITNPSNMGFINNNSFGLSKQFQGSPVPNLNNPSSMDLGFTTNSSIGLSRLNQGNSALSMGSANSSTTGPFTDKKVADLGSIFDSSKNEQAPLRIAPPPPHGQVMPAGRGRGRGRGRNHAHSDSAPSVRSGIAKAQTEQPSLMDLL